MHHSYFDKCALRSSKATQLHQILIESQGGERLSLVMQHVIMRNMGFSGKHLNFNKVQFFS